MATLWQIKTKIWQEMEVNSDSTTYNDNRLRDMINEVSREILEGKVADELTWKYIQWNILDFNKWKTAFEVLPPKSLEKEIEIDDDEIYFNTEGYPDVWAVLIGDEVVEYSGKDADKITNCKGILSKHKVGTIIRPLYVLPRDLWKPLRMYKVINESEIETLYRDNENRLSRYYEIKEGYILTYWLKSGYTQYLEYTKVYEDLVNDTDESILPDSISMNILPFIAWGRMIKDEVLRIKLLTQWYNKIMTEYTKQGESLWKHKKIEWKRFGFSSLR